MGKKGGKKGGGKKGKGPKEPAAPKEPSALALIRQQIENESKPRYCSLHMHLMGWQYANGTIVLKETSTIHELRQLLTERHGSMSELKICKESFSEQTEMTDEFRTLADYGFVGSCEGEPPSETNIFYDFKACNYDDPLLLTLSNRPDKKMPELPPEEDEEGEEDGLAEEK
jgi:hypothetical protein